jgi:DNA-binding NtrC family response regulator
MRSSGKIPNKRILVVDDEQDVLDFLKIYLGSIGWEVSTVDSAGRALAELLNNDYFLVLTDIAMPDMDGYEFVTAMRAEHIPSQVLLMTGFGYNPNHTLVKLNKTARHTCLFKPFDRSKLSQSVQKAFDEYHKSMVE